MVLEEKGTLDNFKFMHPVSALCGLCVCPKNMEN